MSDDPDYASLLFAMACDNKTEGDSHQRLKVMGPAVKAWFDAHDKVVYDKGSAEGYNFARKRYTR